MKIAEIFSSEGKYSRSRYNITELTINVLIIAFIVLIMVNCWFFLLAIPGWLVLWFIHVQSTVKRLHDLGKKEGDIFKLMIPMVGSFLHWRLHWQAGQDEQNIDAYYDYKRQLHDKRYGNEAPNDWESRY
jgi:uncharacterized membrane protein YhaH (DUF805 family)